MPHMLPAPPEHGVQVCKILVPKPENDGVAR